MANLVTKISMALLVVALVSAFMITTTAGCKSEGTWCEEHSECCKGYCHGYSIFRGDGLCDFAKLELTMNMLNRDASGISSTYLRAVVVDADDPSPTQKLAIRIKGDNLGMHCEKLVSATNFFDHDNNMNWTIPSTVPETRVKYIENRADRHVVGDYSFQKQVVTIMIINITESESGKYTCSTSDGSSTVAMDSRDVEVLDKNGGRYVRLDENGSAIRIAGLKGEIVKWLVDLTDFPSANITWIDPQGDPVNTATASDARSDAGAKRVRTAWKKGAPQRLFVLSGLTEADRGLHRLRADIGNAKVDINVTVNVKGIGTLPREPPTVTLKELRSEPISSEYFGLERNLSIGECEAFGSRELNVTVSFLICPKFQSLENHTRLNFDDNSTKFVTTIRLLLLYHT